MIELLELLNRNVKKGVLFSARPNEISIAGMLFGIDDGLAASRKWDVRQGLDAAAELGIEIRQEIDPALFLEKAVVFRMEVDSSPLEREIIQQNAIQNFAYICRTEGFKFRGVSF